METVTLPEGILLIDKPSGRTSFSVVAVTKKRTKQPKVGHAGTLDPFATGLLVLLLGRSWTRTAGTFLEHDKEYEATLRFGRATDTYDREGVTIAESPHIPLTTDVETVLQSFQGEYWQTPPMFSAKKVKGKRLYELARKGISIAREQKRVHITTRLVSYCYPDLTIHLYCSKGTYVRSIANDLGERLGCYAHVHELSRVRSGPFSLDQAISFEQLEQLTPQHVEPFLIRPDV